MAVSFHILLLLHYINGSSFVRSSPSDVKRPVHAAAISILLSPGLIIIDHMHFQYNGFLYGILVLSLVLARKKSTILASGLLFSALLCLKHIYLYLAPAYFVYLLRAYCLGPKSILHIKFANAMKLGLGIFAIFGAAFGRVISEPNSAAIKQAISIFSRLMPRVLGSKRMGDLFFFRSPSDLWYVESKST